MGGFGSWPKSLPSDTKVLLTKNDSKLIIFQKITNFKRNSSKKPVFAQDFEGSKYIKNVVISQRVLCFSVPKEETAQVLAHLAILGRSAEPG